MKIRVGGKVKAIMRQSFKLLAFETLVLLVTIQNSSADSDQVCTSQRCIDTAKMFTRNMDWGALPCHNFYDFMCRNFHKTNPIKPGQGRESAFSIRERYVDEKLLAFLQSEEDNSSTAQKVRTHYQNCMDEATIEELGASTVPLELNSVGLPINLLFNPTLVESYNFSKLLARLHRQASHAKFLFNVSMVFDSSDATKNRLTFEHGGNLNYVRNDERTIDQEALGIRSRATSQDEEIRREKEREFMKEVVQYMSDITNQQSSEKATKLIETRIQKAIDFLGKLRETNKIEKPEDEIIRMNVAELQKKTDEILGSKSLIKINWLEYVETLFENIRDNAREIYENGEPILFTNMKQFEAVLRVVATVDQKTFVSAVWWIVTRSVSAFATKELRRTYYDTEVQVWKNEIASRQVRCLNIIKNEFPFILGPIMVYGNENAVEDQDKAFEMLDYMRRAFEDTIIKSSWLDTGTKMAALNKLQYIRQSISFENWMLNPAELEEGYRDTIVIPGQYFTTLRLIKRYSRDQNLSLLGKDNNFSRANGIPSGEPGEVNATYLRRFNGIQIPIGILGHPFYGLGLEALNYGAIGVVIGHELGHAFDNTGKDFNTFGVKKPWYKKRTKTEYGKRASCFIKSYNEIMIPELRRKVNGKLTLDENLADYLGFTHALKAYRMYVRNHGPEKRLTQFEHFSHERLLAMAYANIYCENSATNFANWLLNNDVHAPGRARVLGVLRNSADFSRTWNCGQSSPMNPTDKCTLW